ncbi:OmpA family protein [Mesoflavibacter zeaxanthinifaciens]|uniref:OmpA family protein n=1 Tax=Mesoflavibacter zeaxanthinifaciens TaxID=393060 RepID=UPI003A8E3E77
MSKKSRYLLGILLTIIIGTVLYWFFCCQYCTDSIENKQKDVSVAPKVTIKPITFNDPDGDFNLEIKDNFSFKFSDYHFIEPISPELNQGLDQIATYLNNHPDKSLDVKGFYKSVEINNSAFPTIGLARANVIKNLMASKGVNFKNINTYGVLDNDLNRENDTINGGISFKVSAFKERNSDQDEALKDLAKSIKANPLILHFETAQTNIVLTKEQRQKVADMVDYVYKVDGASITVTGHTDNQGSRDTNIKVGQERADFAKNYLLDNGISSSKISSTSLGPDQPIADNTTEEGRAQNRRVVITIN